MSWWYQWFIAAPMMIIERPLRLLGGFGELARDRDHLVRARTPVISSCHFGV